MRGHAVLDGHGRRERRRHVHDRARDRRQAPATTPTASRSRPRRRRRPSRASAARPPRRRSSTAAPRVTTRGLRRRRRPGRRALRPDHASPGSASREATIGVELFGPFATRAAIKLHRHAVRTARGLRQGRRHAAARRPCASKEAGFYTYREHLVGTDLIAEDDDRVRRSRPRRRSARPLIITGRGDVTRLCRRWAAADPLHADARAHRAPRHRRAGLAGRDRREARRARRPGRRSASSAGGSTARLPGATAGAVLIAGHVDSATAGAGAFFRLKDARAGRP